MVWYLEPPGSSYVVAGVFALLAGIAAWRYWERYQFVYSPRVALRNAVLTALVWLATYGGSFVLVFWVVIALLPPGTLRYLLGAGAWSLLSLSVTQVLFAALVARVFDG